MQTVVVYRGCRELEGYFLLHKQEALAIVYFTVYKERIW